MSPPYEVRIGQWLSRSWIIFKANAGLLLASHAIILILGVGLELIPFVGWVAGFILFGPLWMGSSWVCLRLVRGEPATLSDAFAGFGSQFGALAVAGIIFQLGIMLGLLLLIIPGVFLFVAWYFAFLIALDKKTSGWQALELSRQTVQKRWFAVFGFVLVNAVLILSGLLAFGIGIFLTFPLGNVLFAVAYQDIFGDRVQLDIREAVV
jgi:uncharacterized membrane protein